jgi:hypothetical protein
MEGWGEEVFCFWVGAELPEVLVEALFFTSTAFSDIRPFGDLALSGLASPDFPASPDDRVAS